MKHGKDEALSQIRGDKEDMTTECNAGSWNRKRTLAEKLVRIQIKSSLGDSIIPMLISSFCSLYYGYVSF